MFLDRLTPTPIKNIAVKNESANNSINNSEKENKKNKEKNSKRASKSCSPQVPFSSSTPAKLDNSSGKKSYVRSKSEVSKSMEGDDSWWSDDETDISGTVVESNYDDSPRTKSLSLPARNLGLQKYQDDIEGSPSSQSSVKIDSCSVNHLSSSVKSCDDASAFESFSCTDEDEDDCDESDQDSTSVESSSFNNR